MSFRLLVRISTDDDDVDDETGLYYLWDDKPFSEQSADDLVQHFKVNVVVGTFLFRSTLAFGAILSLFANHTYRVPSWSQRPFCPHCPFPPRPKSSISLQTLQV